jgi:hypothetical protein
VPLLHTKSNEIFTIGHSNLDLVDFVAVLARHRVGLVCDVRSRPGSFRFAQFNVEPLEVCLAPAKIQHQFLGESLGAILRRKEDPDAGMQ